jgi:hypothetical protein
VHRTTDEAALLEVREHLRHRRRLDAFTAGELAGAHRAGVGERRHRRQLGQRDGHVDALVADEPGEAQQ